MCAARVSTGGDARCRGRGAGAAHERAGRRAIWPSPPGGDPRRRHGSRGPPRRQPAFGNPAEAAVLECTVLGPALRFLITTRFAVTGGDLGAVLHRSDLGSWPVPLGSRILARAGNVLAFTGRRSGCRAYVAFTGVIEAPLVLGSRATDLAGGFDGVEGRALRAGDNLPLGPPALAARRLGRWRERDASDIAPSLYVKRTRRAGRPRPEVSDVPVAPAAGYAGR
jgi:allophanate hydrolase subunit 2